MNELAVGASDRELAKHLLEVPANAWRMDETLKRYGGERIQATREALSTALVPLKTKEPQIDGEETQLIVKPLKMIGAKIRPDWSADVAKVWVMAVIAGLSDLPAHIILRAAHDAVHCVFEYPTDVEAKVREIGNAKLEAQKRAIRRLDAMQAEIIRARTQVQIEDKDQRHREPITDAEVHSLQRTAVGKEIVRMGLAAGYIKPEQLLPPEALEEGGIGNE